MFAIASTIDSRKIWVTKLARSKAARSTPLGGVGGRERKIEAAARLQQVDENQAEGERDQAGADEPAERLGADPAERGGVAHMGDSDDQRREDQRRDDHLDQVQEERRQDREIAGDVLEAFGRAGVPSAIVALIAQPTMMPSTRPARMK